MARAQLAASGIDAMIAVSKDTRDNYLELCPKAAPIFSIPNGIELSELASPCERPRSLPAAIRPDQYFLFIGRLTHRKAVDVLIRAYSRLDKANRIPLVIAGYGKEKVSLKRLSRELDLGDDVIFLGSTFSEKKTYLLQNARCTIVPTRSWEACSLVTLESFAAGTPVIGTRVEGIEHLIQDGVNGLLVAPEDPRTLSAAMESLLVSPRKSVLMGQNAEKMLDSFDIDNVANRHLDLYQELILGLNAGHHTK
jgi:glycosyltransferase involved in cell wall biosynthesis